MLKKLILLVVFLMSIAVPYASAVPLPLPLPLPLPPPPPPPALVIHWKFDNSLANIGTAGSAYDLPMPTSAPTPNYTTGLDSGALLFSKNDTSILTAIMNKVATLPLYNATISFNLKQVNSWNNFIILADADASVPSLSLYINGIPIHSVATTDPIAVLKNATFTNTFLQNNSTLSDGAIDDFRVFNYVVNTIGINALSQPALFNQVNTDGSPNVSIDEIVKFMSITNTYNIPMVARLLALIKPTVTISNGL